MKNNTNEQKNKNQEIDDFWDISSLVPNKQYVSTSTKRISPNVIENSVKHEPIKQTQSDTVIKRYVDPLHFENKKIRREAYLSEEVYYPENSLLHMVTLRKRKSEYNLYSEFYDDAKRYQDVKGEECAYVPFYSYVPQYNQLDKNQLDYYLWWRECFKEGQKIKADVSYVLLYVFELINLGSSYNALEHQRILCELWNAYHGEFPAISSKLAIWICDFSLLYRISSPLNIGNDVLKCVPSLKEFYLEMPKEDYKACALSLLKYGTEYDYHLSKYAKGENLKIFDKYVLGAVLSAVEFYSDGGVILSKLSSEDSKLIRNAFEGAPCISAQRYEIEVKYCSFSRSNELRYLMADIVKYAENKIRTYLGIKSKLTVYSVSVDLQRALDKYFEAELFSLPKNSRKKEEAHEYDVLYDLPEIEFSLEKAKQIEKESWSVTNDLVSAFYEEDISSTPELKLDPPVTIIEAVPPKSDASEEEAPLRKHLCQYIEIVDAIKQGNADMCRDIAMKKGLMPETAVDLINEIAVEQIGDILIEECSGFFSIVECYSDMI